MTVAEFLAWDDGTDTRYELIEGRPVAMAPVAPSHSIIASNLVRGSRARPEGDRATWAVEAGIDAPRPRRHVLRGRCRRQLHAARAGHGHDSCAGHDPEVLSPSTLEHDRGRKT